MNVDNAVAVNDGDPGAVNDGDGAMNDGDRAMNVWALSTHSLQLKKIMPWKFSLDTWSCPGWQSLENLVKFSPRMSAKDSTEAIQQLSLAQAKGSVAMFFCNEILNAAN